MQVKLLAVTKPENMNVAELAEYAGRVCTNTTEKTGVDTAGFLQARIRQGHESILEHVAFTFEIAGISRACSHQLVRHRLASYSQQSQRYVKQGQNYVMPPSIAGKKNTAQLFADAMDAAWATYESLIANGIKPEDARFVLPIATKTTLVVTMNLRQWRHFVKVRGAKDAQWEIQMVARAIQFQIVNLLKIKGVI